MLDYARLLYDWVVLDLPTIFERTSTLAVTESQTAFLVSTSELPSLHLGRKAIRMLSGLGFGRERLRMIVNRMDRRSELRPKDMEAIFECPIYARLPNDYFSLHRAASAGNPLGTDCDLGRAFADLSASICGKPGSTADDDAGAVGFGLSLEHAGQAN